MVPPQRHSSSLTTGSNTFTHNGFSPIQIPPGIAYGQSSLAGDGLDKDGGQRRKEKAVGKEVRLREDLEAVHDFFSTFEGPQTSNLRDMDDAGGLRSRGKAVGTGGEVMKDIHTLPGFRDYPGSIQSYPGDGKKVSGLYITCR